MHMLKRIGFLLKGTVTSFNQLVATTALEVWWRHLLCHEPQGHGDQSEAWNAEKAMRQKQVGKLYFFLVLLMVF